jgi:hypothetical protein
MFDMQVDVEELLILAVIFSVALFWLIPLLIKGIANRLKRIFGGLKNQD